MKRHLHICACGDWFSCSQPPDRCAVPNNYTCPNCDQRDFDLFLSTQLQRTQPAQEMTRHEK